MQQLTWSVVVVLVRELTLVRPGAAQRRFDHKAELASRWLLSTDHIICGTTAEHNLRRAVHELTRIASSVMMDAATDATEFT